MQEETLSEVSRERRAPGVLSLLASRGEALAAWCVIAAITLIPVAFLPDPAAPLLFTKTLLVAFLVVIAFVLAGLSMLEKKEILIPKSPVILAAWLIPIAYALSALFSGAPAVSFFGYEAGTDTVVFAVLLALMATVPAFAFKSKADVVRAYLGLFIAGAIVIAFQLVRLFFGPTFLALGVFTSPLSSIVGGWNDLAIFLGLIVVLTLIALESLPLPLFHRFVLVIGAALALFLLVPINFVPVWFTVAAFALALFLYTLVQYLSRPGSSARPSLPAIAVFLVALLFSVFVPSLSESAASSFGVAQIEARPSFESTVAVGTEVYTESAFLGSGPNTFRTDWDRFHPQETNLTPFWNAEFQSGIGIVPTAFVTSGLLGAVAWLAFLALLLFLGIRALLRSSLTDAAGYSLILASGAGSAYLLAFAVFYVPNAPLLLLAFLFVGMLVASLNFIGETHSGTLALTKNPRLGFLAVLLLLVCCVAGMTLLGSLSVHYASAYTFGKANVALTSSDVNKAEALVLEANTLASQDRYHRFTVALALARLDSIISSTPAPSEEEQNAFRASLAQAVEAGIAATKYNAQDFRNWQVLAAVYASVVPLSIDGAHENAVKAYTEARARAPKNPELALNQAQLEIAARNLSGARTHLDEALALKADYTPALLLLSRIELTEGDLAGAIARAESALVFEPSNPAALFQAAILSLENGAVEKARGYLERAVAANPTYSDARYYLGNILLASGDTEGALVQFEAVLIYNPGNAELRSLIETLKRGENPLQGETPDAPKTADTEE